ncbi:unnamed protein product [Closterium sp. Naga37s-1]|nr:unnamed protein product [Closterium sp. Naga37s-1]
MERSVHREEKEKVLVRVNLGDHRENLEVESHGGEVYWVPLGKPLGIVFKENATGDILVDDVQHGGHAEHAPIHKVRAGDRLLATTARSTATSGAAKWATEPVVLNVAGERFETVMAAISSNASYGGDVILARNGAVLVDELVPRGNADKADPPIQPGDRLLATSAWASDPNGQRQQVMFKAVGEPFDIVMAAIGSNSCAQCHIAVVLERQGKGARSE